LAGNAIEELPAKKRMGDFYDPDQSIRRISPSSGLKLKKTKIWTSQEGQVKKLGRPLRKSRRTAAASCDVDSGKSIWETYVKPRDCSWTVKITVRLG
jgi:hypothetical protein